MPTYQYACTSCGNEFERFESIKATPDKNCPKCKKKKAERVISGGGGFIFKGSGFYVTDYKKKSGEPAKAESKPAAGGCGGGCACHSGAASTAKSGKK